MITEYTGSIFDAQVQTFVNPVNCVGVMGAGLAKEFKDRYPKMFVSYQQACSRGYLEIGRLHFWRGNRVRIINFPTKYHWRDMSNLEYINIGLTVLRREIGDNQAFGSIAIPALGCGFGGLAWRDVKPLIVKKFANAPWVDVWLYPPQ